MTRTLGILKKTSLAGLAEGWGDECYVLTTPVTYPQMLELQKLQIDPSNEEAAVMETIKLIKEHVAGGKIKIYEDNELKLADLDKDDIDSMSVEMTDHIFASISGAAYRDPKALNQAPSSAPAPDEPANTTETS